MSGRSHPLLKKPCRKWSGDFDRDGYPRNGYTRLGRIILQLKIGRPIQPGYYALHHCGNRACLEEEHLYEGTPKQNTADIKRHGRSNGVKGEAHVKARLTEAQVRITRQGKSTDVALAKQWGVNSTTVNHARRGITWKHVT